MALRVLVVGNGMVGHRFVEAVAELGVLDAGVELFVVGEERRRAYDRVHLSSVLDGADADDLTLGSPQLYEHGAITLVLGDPVVALDPEAHTARTNSGVDIAFDTCVLATGSAPFVPPVPGADAVGAFVYRTLGDLEAIRRRAKESRAGVVIGGGLLGLEAANALRLLGLDTTIVELAPHLMAAQLDARGGAVLRERVEDLGLRVRTGVSAAEVSAGARGWVDGLLLSDGERLDADLVVFAAGIRPRDALGVDAGLERGPRGGIVVDDTLCTSAPDVLAIGEVACHRDRVYGLVGPGYAMARVAAERIAGRDATFTGADTSTQLKLLGVDVASVGDPHATGRDVVVGDTRQGVWQRLVLGDDDQLLGAVLVGEVASFGTLVHHVRTGAPVRDPLALLGRSGSSRAPVEVAGDSLLCTCHNVDAATIRGACLDGCDTVGALKQMTKAGTGCGSCVPLLESVLDSALAATGTARGRRICAHFTLGRAELYEAVRSSGLRTFSEIVRKFGTGLGCEVCKPAVASILASLESGHILDGETASLQDTNDHFLANLQRDGTYSVVPRVPGGEITPAQLIAVGEVARDFDLYTKITGGQRIDLFGARVEQLPLIWSRLIDAGFESGHAYGKAVRTVKSCVGSTWCRYGVQDSVQLAIDLELRYRGLRSPHKIKLAVSGCARECAEAQGKDVGIIATEKGWNLYVGGNGGMRPVHAELLAQDVDTTTLVRYIDRYLMWYVRTADRLERTATWQRKLPGGIDFVRRVVIDDELGLATELEADMDHHVANYRCEWKETVEDPTRVARFVSFVNTDAVDPSITRVHVRGQRIPDGALGHVVRVEA